MNPVSLIVANQHRYPNLNALPSVSSCHVCLTSCNLSSFRVRFPIHLAQPLSVVVHWRCPVRPETETRLASPKGPPFLLQFVPCWQLLTHWGRDNMDAVSQTTLSNAFSWMKMLEFRLRFHWSLFLWVQLTKFQHWFRQWLGADQATSHYMNQWWLVYWRIYICVTRPSWHRGQDNIADIL